MYNKYLTQKVLVFKIFKKCKKNSNWLITHFTFTLETIKHDDAKIYA